MTSFRPEEGDSGRYLLTAAAKMSGANLLVIMLGWLEVARQAEPGVPYLVPNDKGAEPQSPVVIWG